MLMGSGEEKETQGPYWAAKFLATPLVLPLSFAIVAWTGVHPVFIVGLQVTDTLDLTVISE